MSSAVCRVLISRVGAVADPWPTLTWPFVRQLPHERLEGRAGSTVKSNGTYQRHQTMTTIALMGTFT